MAVGGRAELRRLWKKTLFLSFLLFPDRDFHFSLGLGESAAETLFNITRHNYRVRHCQPASVSPKYSHPKLGVTSFELNLLFKMRTSQTNRGDGRGSLERKDLV